MASSRYDAIVGGGSIAGLAFAAEAAKRGVRVLVLEEHEEIGEPEKCDGLVSLRGLRRYGFPPQAEVIQNRVASAVIHSPSGREAAVSAASLEVVVLDRSGYDKQVAGMAESWGAEILLGARAGEVRETAEGVTVSSGSDRFHGSYYIDATGPASSPRVGIIPAAKFEVRGDWIRKSVVEVFLDAGRYPGFFAWVIPFGEGVAKVGVAGRGIDPFSALQAFLADRPHTVLRKVAAPIYVGGPRRSFVQGRRILVGESCGQVKPTTAGGIMTSIAGSVIAARWVSDSLQLQDDTLISRYQPDWESRFLKELRTMSRLRKTFEGLNNADLDSLIGLLSKAKVQRALSDSDFDFHATPFLGAIGAGGLVRAAAIVAISGAKSFLHRSGKGSD